MTQDIEDTIQNIQDQANDVREQINELLYPAGGWTSNRQLVAHVFAFASLMGQNLGTLENLDGEEVIEQLKEGVFQVMEAERQRTRLRLKEEAEPIAMKM